MNDNSILSTLEFTNICRPFLEKSGTILWADKGFNEYNAHSFERKDEIIASGKFPKGISKQELDAQMLIGYISYHWCKTKAIYDFSNTFLSLLNKTEDTEIFSDILKRLPFTDFVMNLPEGDTYNMMLVHLEFSCPGQTLFLLCPFCMNKEQTHVAYALCMSWCEDGKKLIESFRYLKVQHGEELCPDKENYLRIAVAAAYYLASKNAEIKETTLPKNKRLTVVTKPGAKPKKVNVKTFDVGYVIGKSFEQQMRSANATCAESFSHCGSSHSVRPHVRRAHWHHYWVGEGRTKLEVRWIEPTLVLANGKNEADMAIVRNVKGA